MQREKKILNAASIAAKALDCSMFNTDGCIIDGVSFFTIPSSFNTSDSTLIVVVYLYFLNIAHFFVHFIIQPLIASGENKTAGLLRNAYLCLLRERLNSVNKHYITVYIFASSIQITVNYV